MSVEDAPRSRPQFGSVPAFRADFLAGLFAPVHALRYVLRRPRLWKYSFFSGALAAAIFFGLAALAITFGDNALTALWARPDATGWLVLWWVAAIALTVVGLAAALGVTLVLVGILLGPFMDALSARVEAAILGAAPEAKSTLGQAARDQAAGVIHPLLTLALYLMLLPCVFALGLVPLIGAMVAAALGFMLSASLLALEFTDQTPSRRRFRWREKLAQFRGQSGAYLGLGVGLAAFLCIPILDFFLVPIAVVAGTMLFCGLDEAGRVSVPDRRVAATASAIGAEGSSRVTDESVSVPSTST